MNGRGIADETGIVPLLHQPYTVTGRTLVAHLRHDLIPLCGFGQCSGFVDIMRHRLLYIHMLVQLHGRKRRHRMYIVGSGHRYRVEMLVLLVQHLPEILIIFCLGIFLNGSRRLAIIDIAEIGDIDLAAAIKILEVVMTFAAGANGRNRKPVTGGKKSSAEYMSWNNKESGSSKRSSAQELPAGLLGGFFC